MGDQGRAAGPRHRVLGGGRAPLVIAHRGASGYRPEHTLASYELAASMGADFIEPDLVATADGVLVCRHDVELADTTDAEAGVRAWDLRLEDLRALRARERLPELRGTSFDGLYEVPTFAEVLALAARLGVGVYPETKHPDEHRARGLALEPLVADALAGFAGPVFLQSFSERSLRELAPLGHPLVRLHGSSLDLSAVAGYADAVGPAKSLVDAAYVERAHAHGLLVHPYTFRRENAFLPPELRSGDDPAAAGDWRAEYQRFFAYGVDGVFTDNPDLALAALSR